VVVTGRVAGGVARGKGVGVGVGLGTVTTLRGRESWVRPAKTRSEPTIEITPKTSAAINAIFRLFKPLIKLPIHPPIMLTESPAQISLTFHEVASEQARYLSTL